MTLTKPSALSRVVITDLKTKQTKTITVYPNAVKSTKEVTQKIMEALK